MTKKIRKGMAIDAASFKHDFIGAYCCKCGQDFAKTTTRHCPGFKLGEGALSNIESVNIDYFEGAWIKRTTKD